MPSSTRALIALLLGFAAVPASPAEPSPWIRIGPDGGTVSALAGAPSAPDVLYAGTSDGSVFRSANHGKSWTFAGLAEHQIFVLAVDAKAPDTVYAGTGDGLFKTTDGGANWIEIFPQAPPGQGGQLVDLVTVDPRQPRIVWASFLGTLWKSADGGATWTAAATAPPIPSALAVDPVRSSTVYASSAAGGAFKTTDGGRTWSLIGGGLPAGLSAAAIAVDPRDRKTLLLAGSITPAPVFKSSDGGATWKPSSTGLGGEFVHTLAFDPARPGDVYAATFDGVWKSTNGGAAWKRASAGLEEYGLSDLLATRRGLVAGTGRGVYASADRAKTWQIASAGLSALTILGLAVDRQDPPRLYAGSYSGVLAKTANRGESWLVLPTELPLDLFYFEGPVAIDPHDPLTVYGLHTRGFAVSTNGGRRWTARDLGCLHASRVVLDATVPTTVYVSGFFVIAACGLQPNACSSFRVDASGAGCVRHEPIGRTGAAVIAADPHAPGTVFAVAPAGLFRSLDRGTTWSLFSAGANPGTLTFDPDQPGVVYGTFPGAVGRSSNGGATWSLTHEGFPTGSQVVSLAVDPTDPSTLYASTLIHGVFKSTDSGATWALLAPSPPGLSLSQLVVDPADPAILYVATSAASVLMLRQ